MNPKTLLICLTAPMFIGFSYAQPGDEYLHKMYNAHKGKWYKTFTFVQRTEFYRNDSLVRTATWYEAAIFPHDFRIDMEDPKNANAVIYKRDSTYRFQKGQLARVTAGTNPFTFILGGMYLVPYDSVKAHLQKDGYDLTKGYTTSWQGRKTYVVGALPNDTTSKQMWIDARHLYLVRTLETDRGTQIDAHMSDQVKVGKGWSETKVVFYFNGKLRQMEFYSDIKGDVKLDPRLFDPAWFGKLHWKE
jgi:hypothetical protein